MPDTFQSVTDTLFAYVPTLLLALVVLLAGWLIGLGVSRLVGAGLRRVTAETEPTATTPPGSRSLADVGARATFWVIMLLAVVAFLQVLGLGADGRPLDVIVGDVVAFLPNLLSAVILAVLALVIAHAARFLVSRAARAAGLDRKVGPEPGEAEEARVDLPRALGETTYWLVLLLFVVAILDTLGLAGLLDSLNLLVGDLLGFLPNLLGAALLLVAGWFAATLLRRIVTNLLAAWGLDRLGRDLGVGTGPGRIRLSVLAGQLVYILVLLPVVIGALNALAIDAITEPASDMLRRFLVAIPRLFAAAVLIAIAYVAARVLASITTSTLAAAGFDRLVADLGLAPTRLAGDPVRADDIGRARPVGPTSRGRVEDVDPVESGEAPLGEEEDDPGRRSPSVVAGYLVMLAVVLLASVEALELLEFTVLADMVARFVFFAGDVLLGLLLFGLGLYLADVAAATIRASSMRRSAMIARGARVTIVVLAGFMALGQMGVADDIIVLTFGLMLGAIAVGTAVAFGVGGREIAREQLLRWRDAARGEGKVERRE